MNKPLISVVLLSFVIYHANGRPHAEADCVPAPFSAWSLVKRGTLDLRDYPTLTPYVGDQSLPIRVVADGVWLSRYPPGTTFALVPFVAPIASVRSEPLNDQQMMVLGKFAAAVYVAFAAGFFFLICRQIAPTGAWIATILFSLGTSVCSVASQAIWMHGPATFWLTLALWYCIRSGEFRSRSAIIIGLALGMATITRPTTGVFAVATGFTFLLQKRYRDVTTITLTGLIPVLVMVYINWRYLGSPFLGGYAGEYGRESPPFWVGFGGLLIAPSRGVLVYSPALLLVPWGLHSLRKLDSYKLLLVSWLVAAGVTLLYYSRWHDWKGGWCFGPRFLCETMPIVCLFVAIAYDHFLTSWSRQIAKVFVGLSVAIQMIGIFGYGGYHSWQHRHDLPDHGRCLFELNDTQIEAHTTAIISKFFGKKK